MEKLDIAHHVGILPSTLSSIIKIKTVLKRKRVSSKTKKLKSCEIKILRNAF